MNLLKKIYCRSFQFIMKCAIPFLPYRKPLILNSVDDIVSILKEKEIDSILIVTDKGIKEAKLLDNLLEVLKEKVKVDIYDSTVSNPLDFNVEDALKHYKNSNAKGIIALGGGSVIDVAKAVGARVVRPKKSVKKMKGLLKVRKKLPLLIAIPTTAGTGSEVTVTSVITDSETHHKYTINDFSLIPHYAVLDYRLTLNLPSYITSTTGMDALTHAVEAYIGKTRTKETKHMSLEAVKLIVNNLKKCYDDPKNEEARRNMLYASYYAGIAFTKAYVGYVHAIAHTLGGKYKVPHGLANAVILPIMLECYGSKIYKKVAELARYSSLANELDNDEIATKKFIKWIYDTNSEMNIPLNINSINEEDIPSLAIIASKEANPLYPVPLLMNNKELEKIYLLIKNKSNEHLYKEINITNGEYFNKYYKDKTKYETFPFNDALIIGKTCENILDFRFCLLRRTALKINTTEYIDKMKGIYNLKTRINDVGKFNLFFGKDTFCQVNLLTFLAYLEQLNYKGKVSLNIIDDESFEVLESNINVELGIYNKLYIDILINKIKVDTLGVIDSKAIELYFDYLNENGNLANIIKNNINLNEDELLEYLLKETKEYGLSDLILLDLIKKYHK